ncbi:ribonuclease H-like domain-containing protein, partial [Tanacetum coccineum]
QDAMYDEYNALIKNGIWILVPKPPNVNVVRSMWLFRHKYHADGSLSRCKARLVANGCNQQYGVDYSDTFSPVVKPTTIRTVLSLALTRNWPVHQLDVKNAFLNGNLSKTVYMYQPPGFVDSLFPHHVCRLQRSLYGLKQAPRAWFQRFAGYALRVGFTSSRCDSFFYLSALYMRCYGVVGAVQYDRIVMLLGLRLTQNLNLVLMGIFFCLYILCRAKLVWIMHDPREPHLAALKRVLRYVRGTLDFGLQLYASPTSSLVAYIDADWAGCPTTRRSTSGGEYRGVANVVAKTTWLHNLLRELHTPLLSATLVYCDNVSTIYMTANPVQHQRTKHIETDIHFVRDMVARGQVRVLHAPSRYQYADIFTKGLPSTLFEEFRTSLSVRSSPAQTAKEC